jgi:hypothetical protein
MNNAVIEAEALVMRPDTIPPIAYDILYIVQHDGTGLVP